jgi:hypothetical protein
VLQASPAPSMTNTIKDTSKIRKVAILVADGGDARPWSRKAKGSRCRPEATIVGASDGGHGGSMAGYRRRRTGS